MGTGEGSVNPEGLIVFEVFCNVGSPCKASIAFKLKYAAIVMFLENGGF